jgi:hypothetical protein
MRSLFFIAKYHGFEIDKIVGGDGSWFHDLQASWSEARNYCCKLGMNLVTVYSIEKQDCLSNEFQAEGDTILYSISFNLIIL